MKIKPFVYLLILFLNACSAKDPEKNNLENRLDQLIKIHKLDQSFQADIDLETIFPDITALGGDLFFSPDLSIDGSIACSSCHHPEKAGADGLSLPVGISVPDPELVGEERLRAAKSLYPDAGIQGQIPRNSPTVFNSVLYTKALFWDGRIEYAINSKTGERYIKTGFFGAGQYNPSGYENRSLLQTQARMPMSSVFEMKGISAPDYNNHEIERAVVERLKESPVWCEKFSAVFGKDKNCKENINLMNLSQALAAYQASLYFVKSPFQSYIEGNKQALSEQAKKGAVLFMTAMDESGAGCITCHSGKHFTDEKFYNLNIPASGLGKNANGLDFGRSNVDPDAERFAFRTPGLLNVSATAPYFHNGSVKSLVDAIKTHQKKREGIEFTIIKNDGIDYDSLNKKIKNAYLESGAEEKLPETITDDEISAIEAFIQSLSDPCIESSSCLESFIHKKIVTGKKTDDKAEHPASKLVSKPGRNIDFEIIKAPDIHCEAVKHEKGQKGTDFVIRQDLFNHTRELGLIKRGWLVDQMNNAGMSVADINYDCLDDIVFDAGNNGMKLYLQMPDGTFKPFPLMIELDKNALNPMLLDADGDYQYDLFIGTLGKGKAKLVFDVLAEDRETQVFDSLSGPVINATLADINRDGYVDISFAFWRSFNSVKQQHIWFADGIGNFQADDDELVLRDSGRTMGGNSEVKRINDDSLGSPDLSFTPNFVDMDEDGDDDLLLAADFSRSQVLKNDDGDFIDITDKAVINDSNGMGTAIADFDGDGDMDWFVTSVIDEKVAFIDGHKLYINEGEGIFSRKSITNKANEWSWGACAADFDNDGDEDIFYISGFAEPMKTARYETEKQQQSSETFMQNLRKYSASSPTLLINDGKANFTDETLRLGLDVIFDGRGIGCFDYQQDGDIDIVVNPLEGKPQLFENQSGGNWISLRLTGPPGNTEALGTKVILETEEGKQYRQVRFENNYISRNPAQIHFGLGEQESIKLIRIKYPEPFAQEQLLIQPAINRLHIINVVDVQAN